MRRYKTIIIVLLLVLIINIFFMYKTLNNRGSPKEDLILKNEINNTNNFAIMIEQSDGSYVESTSTSFPKDYKLNLEKSKCVDKNGNELYGILSFDDENKTAVVKTTTTTYCYLYFDKKINLFELCKNHENVNECVKNEELEQINDIWKSPLEDDGYRYVGTNPANYVCFGYSNADTDCDFANTTNTDLYAYRIIGIFEDNEGKQHLKLIKKEALNKTYWWGTDYFVESWESSSLYSNLNDLENIYWSNLIETWDYTAAQTEECGEYYEYTANVGDIYLHEMNRNSKSFSEGTWQTVSAKIGLMYVSDYLLSLGSDALNYTSYTNASTLKTGWMHISNNDSGALSSYEWTMTHALYCGLCRVAWAISSSGYLYSYSVGPEEDYLEGGISVRPVFYLTSGVSITGEGTIENPYIITN